MLSSDDATDTALAAIASILDHPAEKPPLRGDKPSEIETGAVPSEEEARPAMAALAVPEPIDVDTYIKIGPGPLEAIRFRWAARREDDGRYFVDETIGPNSRPMTIGPMPRHEVVSFIDAKVEEAQRRFDALKSEMTMKPLERNRLQTGES
jgi:hypothetical protein